MTDTQREPGRMRRWVKAARTKLNMPVKYATYATGRSAGPIYPDRVYIESTNHCNLKCIMCPTGLGVIRRPKGYMAMDLYRRVIDELGPLVGSAVLHSWGEPLMHPQLFDMIRYGKRAGIRMETSTNITLLDEERGRQVLDAGLDVLYLAMDGATKETYEQVRIGASYDKVIYNLNRLLERKKALNSPTPYLQINMALFPENRHEQQKMIDDWMGKADFVSISNHCVNNVVPELHFRPERVPCPTLWQAMHINTNGDVIACCRDSSYEEVMGNAYETPILDIWNNEKYRYFRKTHLIGAWDDIPMCVRCDSWACRSKRVLRQGDMLVNQYPFYQHFMPIPKVDTAQTVPAPHFMDRVKDTGRAIKQTLISLGTRIRKAS